MKKLVMLLPFMEAEELKDLAMKIINKEVQGVKIMMLYPFLNSEDLNEVVNLCIEKGETKAINTAIPFLNKEMINKIYEGVKDGSIKGVKEHMLLPFLGKKMRKGLFDDLIKEATEYAKAHPESENDDDDDDFNVYFKHKHHDSEDEE